MRQYTSCPWCDATDKADRRSRFGCVSCQHEFHSEPKLAFVTTDNSATLQNALAEIERLKAENAAIRTLMDCYNVGGWTDSLTLIQERDKCKAALRVALDAMELHAKTYPHMQKGYTVDAITKIKEAL